MAFKAAKRRRPPHKKRAADHHRRNDNYIKHYWPYLPMAFIAALGLLISMVLPANFAVLGASSDLSASALLSNTNAKRQVADEPLLTLDAKLGLAAQAKANDMVANNYWSHVSPNGSTPWSFMSEEGYLYEKAGENLAYGFSSSSALLNGWMQSQSHRENILNADYSQIGFGVAHSPNFAGHGPNTVVVAMYGKPASMALQAAYAQSNLPTDIQVTSTESVPVSRVAAISGTQDSLLPMVAAALVSIAIIAFLIRHGRFLHKTLVRGERLALKHPVLDFVLIAIITLGFIVSRTIGFIA